jgi:hypothetical protein
MAISVDTVYKTVLSILNKESRGFLTPEEFNKIGSQVQLDILDQHFYDYNKAVVRHNAGRAVEDYGDIPEKIQQKIDPFYKTSNITLVAGKITIPSDVYKMINISTTDKLLQIEKVNKKNLSYLLSSPLTKPTTSFPVYYQTDTEFVTNPTLTGDLTVEYIKTPADPVWAYTQNASTGALTFDDSSDVPFTLHSSDQVQLILGILKYAGLVIADPTVIQAASAEENKTIQLENS